MTLDEATTHTHTHHDFVFHHIKTKYFPPPRTLFFPFEEIETKKTLLNCNVIRFKIVVLIHIGFIFCVLFLKRN